MDRTPEKNDHRQISERGTRSDDGAGRLQAIFDNVEEGILLLNADGRVLDANRAYLAMHDLPSIANLFRDVNHVSRHFGIFDQNGREVPPEDLPHRRALQGEAVRGEIYRLVNRQTGKSFYGRYSMLPIFLNDDRPQWVLITIHDITDLVTAARERESLMSKIIEQRSQYEDLSARLEEEVAARTMQVRSLSRSLAIIEQSDRAHLSKVLHEDLQQILLATRMRLDLAADDLPPSRPERQDVLEASNLLHKAIRISRALAVELNPPTLESEGFEAALRWAVDYLVERHGIPIKLDMLQPLPPIPRQLGMIALHSVRFALTFTLREFRPESVTVSFGFENQFLTITIEIDGDDPGANRWVRHRGWDLVRDHLRLFGGTLNLEAHRSGMLDARLRLPLSSDQPRGGEDSVPLAPQDQ